jgi:hypothetical protein
MYDPRDIVFESGRMAPHPSFEGTERDEIEDLIETLNDAAEKNCITTLGGAVTDPAPKGTGGRPSTPDPDAGGGETPDSGAPDAS